MSVMQTFLVVLAAMVAGVTVCLLVAGPVIRHVVKGSVPGPPEEPSKVALYLVGDKMTFMDIHEIQHLAAALLRNSEPIITAEKVGEGEMAWRGEVWDSLAEFRAAYLDPEETIPGVIGQPYWLCNGPTEEYVREQCETWLTDQFFAAVASGGRK